ncbi:MAG: nucleotide-binding protein, partial [Candidatus Lokiarchaeota archaeon]
KYSKKIFIIHGHDESMKESVARLLEKLGLEPIILHEQPNEGKTIIEKFEKHSEVGFAIALFSPDDKGFSVKDGEENVKTRARQNVILETGYFFGRLGRNRVIILFKEDENFEFPTDYQGVIYISFDKNEAWKLNIIKEMNSQGYNLDANLLLK